jgi:hypothetical protein
LRQKKATALQTKNQPDPLTARDSQNYRYFLDQITVSLKTILGKQTGLQ